MHNTRSRTALKQTPRDNTLPPPFPIWFGRCSGTTATAQSRPPRAICSSFLQSPRYFMREKKKKKKKQHKRESRWIKQPRCRGDYSGAKSPLKGCGGCMASVAFIGAELFLGICTKCLTSLQKYSTRNRSQGVPE